MVRTSALLPKDATDVELHSFSSFESDSEAASAEHAPPPKEENTELTLLLTHKIQTQKPSKQVIGQQALREGQFLKDHTEAVGGSFKVVTNVRRCDGVATTRLVHRVPWTTLVSWTILTLSVSYALLRFAASQVRRETHYLAPGHHLDSNHRLADSEPITNYNGHIVDPSVHLEIQGCNVHVHPLERAEVPFLELKSWSFLLENEPQITKSRDGHEISVVVKAKAVSRFWQCSINIYMPPVAPASSANPLWDNSTSDTLGATALGVTALGATASGQKSGHRYGLNKLVIKERASRSFVSIVVEGVVVDALDLRSTHSEVFVRHSQIRDLSIGVYDGLVMVQGWEGTVGRIESTVAPVYVRSGVPFEVSTSENVLERAIVYTTGAMSITYGGADPENTFDPGLHDVSISLDVPLSDALPSLVTLATKGEAPFYLTMDRTAVMDGTAVKDGAAVQDRIAPSEGTYRSWVGREQAKAIRLTAYSEHKLKSLRGWWEGDPQQPWRVVIPSLNELVFDAEHVAPSGSWEYLSSSALLKNRFVHTVASLGMLKARYLSVPVHVTGLTCAAARNLGKDFAVSFDGDGDGTADEEMEIASRPRSGKTDEETGAEFSAKSVVSRWSWSSTDDLERWGRFLDEVEPPRHCARELQMAEFLAVHRALESVDKVRSLSAMIIWHSRIPFETRLRFSTSAGSIRMSQTGFKDHLTYTVSSFMSGLLALAFMLIIFRRIFEGVSSQIYKYLLEKEYFEKAQSYRLEWESAITRHLQWVINAYPVHRPNPAVVLFWAHRTDSHAESFSRFVVICEPVHTRTGGGLRGQGKGDAQSATAYVYITSSALKKSENMQSVELPVEFPPKRHAASYNIDTRQRWAFNSRLTYRFKIRALDAASRCVDESSWSAEFTIPRTMLPDDLEPYMIRSLFPTTVSSWKLFWKKCVDVHQIEPLCVNIQAIRIKPSTSSTISTATRLHIFWVEDRAQSISRIVKHNSFSKKGDRAGRDRVTGRDRRAKRGSPGDQDRKTFVSAVDPVSFLEFAFHKSGVAEHDLAPTATLTPTTAALTPTSAALAPTGVVLQIEGEMRLYYTSMIQKTIGFELIDIDSHVCLANGQTRLFLEGRDLAEGSVSLLTNKGTQWGSVRFHVDPRPFRLYRTPFRPVLPLGAKLQQQAKHTSEKTGQTNGVGAAENAEGFTNVFPGMILCEGQDYELHWNAGNVPWSRFNVYVCFLSPLGASEVPGTEAYGYFGGRYVGDSLTADELSRIKAFELPADFYFKAVRRVANNVSNLGRYHWVPEIEITTPSSVCKLVITLSTNFTPTTEEKYFQSNLFHIIRPMLLSELEYSYASFCRIHNLPISENLTRSQINNEAIETLTCNLRVCTGLRRPLPFEIDADADRRTYKRASAQDNRVSADRIPAVPANPGPWDDPDCLGIHTNSYIITPGQVIITGSTKLVLTDEDQDQGGGIKYQIFKAEAKRVQIVCGIKLNPDVYWWVESEDVYYLSVNSLPGLGTLSSLLDKGMPKCINLMSSTLHRISDYYRNKKRLAKRAGRNETKGETKGRAKVGRENTTAGQMTVKPTTLKSTTARKKMPLQQPINLRVQRYILFRIWPMVWGSVINIVSLVVFQFVGVQLVGVSVVYNILYTELLTYPHLDTDSQYLSDLAFLRSHAVSKKSLIFHASFRHAFPFFMLIAVFIHSILRLLFRSLANQGKSWIFPIARYHLAMFAGYMLLIHSIIPYAVCWFIVAVLLNPDTWLPPAMLVAVSLGTLHVIYSRYAHARAYVHTMLRNKHDAVQAMMFDAYFSQASGGVGASAGGKVQIALQMSRQYAASLGNGACEAGMATTLQWQSVVKWKYSKTVPSTSVGFYFNDVGKACGIAEEPNLTFGCRFADCNEYDANKPLFEAMLAGGEAVMLADAVVFGPRLGFKRETPPIPDSHYSAAIVAVPQFPRSSLVPFEFKVDVVFQVFDKDRDGRLNELEFHLWALVTRKPLVTDVPDWSDLVHRINMQYRLNGNPMDGFGEQDILSFYVEVGGEKMLNADYNQLVNIDPVSQISLQDFSGKDLSGLSMCGIDELMLLSEDVADSRTDDRAGGRHDGRGRVADDHLNLWREIYTSVTRNQTEILLKDITEENTVAKNIFLTQLSLLGPTLGMTTLITCHNPSVKPDYSPEETYHWTRVLSLAYEDTFIKIAQATVVEHEKLFQHELEKIEAWYDMDYYTEIGRKIAIILSYGMEIDPERLLSSFHGFVSKCLPCRTSSVAYKVGQRRYGDSEFAERCTLTAALVKDYYFAPVTQLLVDIGFLIDVEYYVVKNPLMPEMLPARLCLPLNKNLLDLFGKLNKSKICDSLKIQKLPGDSLEASIRNLLIDSDALYRLIIHDYFTLPTAIFLLNLLGIDICTVTLPYDPRDLPAGNNKGAPGGYYAVRKKIPKRADIINDPEAFHLIQYLAYYGPSNDPFYRDQLRFIHQSPFADLTEEELTDLGIEKDELPNPESIDAYYKQDHIELIDEKSVITCYYNNLDKIKDVIFKLSDGTGFIQRDLADEFVRQLTKSNLHLNGAKAFLRSLGLGDDSSLSTALDWSMLDRQNTWNHFVNKVFYKITAKSSRHGFAARKDLPMIVKTLEKYLSGDKNSSNMFANVRITQDILHNVLIQLGISHDRRDTSVYWSLICSELNKEEQSTLSALQAATSLSRIIFQPVSANGSKYVGASLADIHRFVGALPFFAFESVLRAMGLEMALEHQRQIWELIPKTKLDLDWCDAQVRSETKSSSAAPEFDEEDEEVSDKAGVKICQVVELNVDDFVSFTDLRKYLARCLLTGLPAEGVSVLVRLCCGLDKEVLKIQNIVERNRRRLTKFGVFPPSAVKQLLCLLHVEGIDLDTWVTLIRNSMSLNVPAKELRRVFNLIDINQNKYLECDEVIVGVSYIRDDVLPAYIISLLNLTPRQQIAHCTAVAAGIVLVVAFLCSVTPSFLGTKESGLSTSVQNILAIAGAIAFKTGTGSRDPALEEKIQSCYPLIFGDDYKERQFRIADDKAATMAEH
ncbi:putative transmembrane protein [Gregarina niphandrodes]|uniref:Transmembrane protein n=1 Tax=Gregarina niphandrodes TaxID=110365 RepID=A0A023AZ14_GRENI|nr:putative transmembrane protein [Gregarina niphandrodes]EZG43743.1 putative transmembrane protein [Gregarina niphandrodes]|eukprot:XP_011133030.1 putative transmembrane protein [Gregarina niphandrodes]